MSELQRTYRGKAWRDAEPAERRDVERAVVVASLDGSPDDQDDRMAEFGELLKTAGAVPVATIVQRRDRPVPRTYLGRGKLEELGAAAAGLRDIRSRQGAYFVTGNHEYYSGFREWVDEIARLDIRPLRNERLEIATGRGVFDLAGVNDPGGEDFGDPTDFARALGDRDTARPVVLMAHQPVVAHTIPTHLAAIEHAIGNAEHVVGIEFLLHRFDDLDVGL